MVSEEIELNHYLEAKGIKAVESDLGEFIVQMAGEKTDPYRDACYPQNQRTG